MKITKLFSFDQNPLFGMLESLFLKRGFTTNGMSSIALGVWVAFLKQPDALPGRAPQKNKNYIFLNYF
jgi:hypothetical protein